MKRGHFPIVRTGRRGTGVAPPGVTKAPRGGDRRITSASSAATAAKHNPTQGYTTAVSTPKVRKLEKYSPEKVKKGERRVGRR